MTTAGQDDGPVVQDGVGEPDQFLRLWTPHRMAYIKGENKPTTDGDDCPFCRVIRAPGRGWPHRGAWLAGLCRAESVPVQLRPPHGCPYRHVADYPDLTAAETAELADFTKRAMLPFARRRRTRLQHRDEPGRHRGRGIAAHLHQHVVPRWGGDTNFMPVVGHTKVLPQLLADTRALLAAAWPGPARKRRLADWSASQR